MSTSSPHALSASPLALLPAEVRTTIWSYVFEDTIIHYPLELIHGLDRGLDPNYSERAPITYACKWIHHEATSILASESTLHFTRRDISYPDLPDYLRSAVLPYVRSMIVHNHGRTDPACRIASVLSPILAAASSLNKVQIGHFHLDGQSMKFYPEPQSSTRNFHDRLHGQNSSQAGPNYAKTQTDIFLDRVHLHNGPRLEPAGGFMWLHILLLKKRPSIKLWVSVSLIFALTTLDRSTNSHLAVLVSLTIPSFHTRTSS